MAHQHLVSVRRMHGAGGQPQSKLECVAERTVAESQYSTDGQRGEPDRRRPGITAEYPSLVLLRRCNGLLLSWRAVMERRRLAAAALEVSF